VKWEKKQVPLRNSIRITQRGLINSASAAASADARHVRSFSAVGFFRVGVAIAQPFHLQFETVPQSVPLTIGISASAGRSGRI